MSIKNMLNPTGHHACSLEAIGTVEDVIAGVIAEPLKNQRFNAFDFKYGFELASPKTIQSMGESVLVNNRCYTTSTDPNDCYQRTISGKHFYTSGMFIVPHTAEPAFTLIPKKCTGLSYQSLCDEIHMECEGPAFLAAIVKFKRVNATSIKKPPIQGDNIFEHFDRYYDKTKQRLDDVYAFITAGMAHFHQDNKHILNALRVVLYDNPCDTVKSLNVHTHGLFLNDRINSPEEVLPENVTHTLHVFNEQALLDEVIWGNVFSINAIKQLKYA